MEFRVNLDLYLLDKLERERSVSWYTPIHDTKVTLTLASSGVDPVLAENDKLRTALLGLLADMIGDDETLNDPTGDGSGSIRV